MCLNEWWMIGVNLSKPHWNVKCRTLCGYMRLPFCLTITPDKVFSLYPLQVLVEYGPSLYPIFTKLY